MLSKSNSTKSVITDRMQEALDILSPTINELGLPCPVSCKAIKEGCDKWAMHAFLSLFSLEITGIRGRRPVELWVDNYSPSQNGRVSLALFLSSSDVKKLENSSIGAMIKIKFERIEDVDCVLNEQKMYYEDYSNSKGISSERFLSIYCNDLKHLPEQFQAFYEKIMTVVQSAKSTTRQAIINARYGQGQFRRDVGKHWGNKCCVTGCSISELLRASHIKPWTDCDDRDRLNPLNGLFLIGTLDLAFDKGLISFDDSGIMLFSNEYLVSLANAGISQGMKILKQNEITPKVMEFLAYHRKHVFRGIQKD